MTGVPGSPLASSSTAESVSELTVLARADLRGETAVFGWGETWAEAETDTTLGDLDGFSSDIDLQGNKSNIYRAGVVLCSVVLPAVRRRTRSRS